MVVVVHASYDATGGSAGIVEIVLNDTTKEIVFSSTSNVWRAVVFNVPAHTDSEPRMHDLLIRIKATFSATKIQGVTAFWNTISAGVG